jgi:DNA repair protein RadD
MKPRYYQNDAVYSIWNYFKTKNGNPIVAMPTGTGKSIVNASFIKSVYHYFPNQKIISITHVKELIEQNFEKLITIWPTAPAGIFSAGLKRKDRDCAITFAGVASIIRIAEELGKVDLVIVDECHLVSPKANSNYGKFFTALLKVNPRLKVIGLTATPYRLGQGYLTEQPSLWTDICYDLTSLDAFNKLVAEGYISPLIPKRTEVVIDVSGVGSRGGEFIEKELQAASDREEITRGALLESRALGHDRDHWLIFATGVDHAEHIKEGLDSLGIRCGIVHSKMEGSREEEIRLFKSGYYRAMVTVGVLTTGFDYPEIDMIIMLRPTSSPGLWVQMLGRGTRPSEGKNNCLVLDFAGNTLRLGPINDPVIPKKKGKKGGVAPVRLCGGCDTYIHASLRICPHCGEEIILDVKFRSTSGTAELIAAEEKPAVIKEFKVIRATYKPHHKAGKPSSMKVTYYCGLRTFSEWICLFHQGNPRRRAREWWGKASDGEVPYPEDIEEALEFSRQLRSPNIIKVQIDLKYPEILEMNYFD